MKKTAKKPAAKMTSKKPAVIPPNVLAVIDREITLRKGALVDVKAMKKPGHKVKKAVLLVKACGHRPRVGTPRAKVRCAECRPTWAESMSEKDVLKLTAQAADFRAKYISR